MKRLIINSDDYGRTPEISRGIRVAHLRGVVTSTTCMMNMPKVVENIAEALYETPNLKLGVHLVLTVKKPVLPHAWAKSITDGNGNFLKYDAFIANLPSLKMEEVKAEWRAQIEAFIKAASRKPDHLDSHHHSSFFTPELFRGMLEIAQEYDCAVRFPFTNNMANEVTETGKYAPDLIKEFNPRKPDTFLADFYDEGATQAGLLKIINSVGNGASELMCHPGYVDEAFAKESVYNFQRARELKILTDPAIKQAIASHNIELITFADL